jgi:GTP cyclohydrolase II
LFTSIIAGLHKLEEHVASIAAFVIDELDAIRLHSERIVGDLFEEGSDHGPAVPSIPMAAPDTGLSVLLGFS